MIFGGQCGDPAALPLERDWAPILQEVDWAAGPVWTGVENFAVSSNPYPTAQPVASHYADWAILVHLHTV